jgi:glycosyltransferase involved in cell wall biosynthesis
MFLTIITRTYKRPQALKACVDSVLAQAQGECEQLFLVDDVGIGIAETYQQMSVRDWSDVKGDYVYILDDDNVLLPCAIVALKEAAEKNPDLIIARADMGKWGLLPDNGNWGCPPKMARIDMGCAVLRRDLFLKAIKETQACYEGDYHYIAAAYRMAGLVAWLDETIMRVQRVSHGEPE